MEKGVCHKCGAEVLTWHESSSSGARPLLTFTLATASGVVASVHLLLTQHDSFTWILTAGPIVTTALASLLSWLGSATRGQPKGQNPKDKE